MNGSIEGLTRLKDAESLSLPRMQGPTKYANNIPDNRHIAEETLLQQGLF